MLVFKEEISIVTSSVHLQPISPSPSPKVSGFHDMQHGAAPIVLERAKDETVLFLLT